MKGLFLFTILCLGLAWFAINNGALVRSVLFKDNSPSSALANNKGTLSPIHSVKLNIPNMSNDKEINEFSQSPESFQSGLQSFASEPLESIDETKYNNFFEEAVLNEGKLFVWHKSNLSYFVDKTAERRITKSKIKRAFEHWSKKSKIFTFYEAPNQESADIFIHVATASEKDRMGEAGPDEAYEVGQIKLNGAVLTKYIIKHAKVTIALDFFDYDKLKEYQENQSDQGFQTLVHELGHVLGIMGHSNVQGDCMYPTAHPSGKACDVLTAEINTLAMIYGKQNALTRGFYQTKNF